MGLDIDLSLIEDKVVRDSFQKLMEDYESNPFLAGEWQWFTGATHKPIREYKIRHNLGFIPQDVFVTWVTNEVQVTILYTKIDKEWLVFETFGKCSFRVVAGRLA
jgi:hypothetical protein